MLSSNLRVEDEMMKKQPLVSVVIVTYNQEAYIAQAIDSVLMQETDFSYEVLIGDDASTDDTTRIVTEYAARFPDIIVPYIRPSNLGATRNSYELLKHMRGEYFAFLDGDDYWIDPFKLQKQVDFLRTHPRYIGCTHRLQYVDENGITLKRHPRRWVSKKQEFTLYDFDGIRLPGQTSSLVRRNIFLHPQHDYSILVKLDREVSDRTSALIFLLQGDFYCFQETMGAYRYITNAKSKNLTAQVFHNAERTSKDFQMACRMEEYAKAEFGIEISFASFKRELYAKTLFQAIKNHSAGLLLAAHKMRCSSKRGYLFILSLPYHVLRLTWHHIWDY